MGRPTTNVVANRLVYLGAVLVAGLALAPGVAAVLMLVGAGAAVGGWLAKPVMAPALVARIPPRSSPALSGFLPPKAVDVDKIVLVRSLLVGCQALTILVTWRLWQARGAPPMLPVPGYFLPQVSFGPALLASLALVLARPRLGGWFHVVLLASACLADQTRIQPETVSLALLVLATTLPRVGPTLARSHLSSLWIWAGVHKLLSTGFAGGSAMFMFKGLPLRPGWLEGHFGWAVAGMEIGVGILSAIPRSRRAGVVGAFVLHGSILYILSPFGNDWNISVWPWNLALPLAALAFFWPAGDRGTRGAMPERQENRSPVFHYAIPVVAMVIPAGFYLGIVDAYVSHNLYTDNTAGARCEPPGACGSASFDATWSAFDVPLPPEPRLYVAYFRKGCMAGERLTVTPRRVRVLFGLNSRSRTYDCPARGDAQVAGDLDRGGGSTAGT